MFRSNPKVDRFLDFFTLVGCYSRVLGVGECTKSRRSVARDMIRLFFSYKTYPDHYAPCRLWEVDESEWKFYYGSNYRSHQRSMLSKSVQPREYGILFSDKEVCEMLCRQVGVRLPRTCGTIRPDQDYRGRVRHWLGESEGCTLFIKPLLGSAGRGIVLARREPDGVVIQNKEGAVPLESFQLEQSAIVQEKIIQDDRMAAFSHSSVNTVRVVTMYRRDDSVIILGATLRCGVDGSYVDNWTAGGVAVGIDWETGRLKKFAFNKRGMRFSRHPTSGTAFEGFEVPQWDGFLDVATRVQKAFPCYRILGMDIALQEGAGPVLIEVNESTDLLFQEQTSGPLLKVQQNLRSFGEYELLVNRHQRRLYDDLAR